MAVRRNIVFLMVAQSCSIRLLFHIQDEGLSFACWTSQYIWQTHNKYLVGVTVEQLYSTQLLEIQKLMVTGLSSLYKYVVPSTLYW